MRTRVRDLLNGSIPADCHWGLAHERLALLERDGEDKDQWLNRLAAMAAPAPYRVAHARWRRHLQDSGAEIQEYRAKTRLLVGHGYASGSEVGLTVHHSWGTPLIPGSALKGLLAHYVATRCGDDDDWRGPTIVEGRVIAGPGRHYRALFGSPAVDAKTDACRGCVIFHDALYVPNSAPDDKPYARDVLTVHQKRYYNSRGGEPANDYDSPNPVGFITVRPDSRFTVALGGPADWAKLAIALLLEALAEQGVGSKTSAGYGRLEPANDPPAPGVDAPAPRPRKAPQSELLGEFERALGEGGFRENLPTILEVWPERLRSLSQSERKIAATRLNKKLEELEKKKRVIAERERLRAWIEDLRA